MLLPLNAELLSSDEMMQIEGGSRAEKKAIKKAAKKAVNKNFAGLVATAATVIHNNFHMSYDKNVKHGGKTYHVTYNGPKECSMPKPVKYVMDKVSWI